MTIPIENMIIVPFIIVFFLCWFSFCLLIIFKPHAWIDFQNLHSKRYGFELTITDEKKFAQIHRKTGFWLVVLGVCALLIILGFVTEFIPIIY